MILCRFSCLFLLLTKLLFGVIRDLNGLWCSTENIYSIYWRSMPAVFRFQAVCACVRVQSLCVCEREWAEIHFGQSSEATRQAALLHRLTRTLVCSLSSWHAFCMLNTNRWALKFLFCNCIHDGHRRRVLNLRARYFSAQAREIKEHKKRTSRCSNNNEIVALI